MLADGWGMLTDNEREEGRELLRSTDASIFIIK